MPDNWLTSAARFLRPSAAPARAAAEPPAGCALTPSNRYVDGEDAASYRERLIRDIEGEGADCATAHQLIDRRISNLADPAQREHAPHHIVRYLTTYAVTPKGPGVLVDIGASEIYGAPLETLKGWDIRAVPVLSFDYEVDRLPFADESADGVLICEVIEHFAMDPLFCFIEINRILKPNGFVVVTTPNAASWFSIYRVLNQEHPSCWPFYSLDESKRRHHIHVREYLVSEVEQLLDAAGFGGITTFTRDYAMRPPYRPIPGVSTGHRGETIFSRGYKAGPPRKRALPPLYLEDVDFKPGDR
ncbi:MAG: methyltransferase domain-containing protein [Reyranella sp.]|uniref:methyltransferase domain-containing protein n=1 Tax=Reyranella sp. TaxID=1929291 RepID=UPI003D0AEE29